MEEDTQKELLALLKRALVVISAGRRDEELLYEIRDTVRKVEDEVGEDD